MDTKDYSIIVCKICNKECKRIFAGRYPNGKDKKWTDENGREFNGKMCPACHAEKCASRIVERKVNAKKNLKKSLFVE